MSYIGNPIVSTDFPVDYFSGNGSTTAFTLSIAPASVNSLDVQVSGVSQSPQTYTVSGTTLTFSAAPPTGSSNIVVRHLGIAGIPNTPSASSVTSSSLSNLTTLPVSGGYTATLPALTGTVAVADGSGNLSVTGVLSFNSGFGTSRVAYGCRSWVKFNGTGTIAIYGSGNVSSIGDVGTGVYAVNFIITMPDLNYAGVASFQVAAWANYQIITYGYQVGGYLIGISVNTSGAGVDNNNVSSATFR